MEENNRRFDEKVDAKKSKLMPDEEDDMIIRTERDLKSIIEQAILIGSEPSSRMIKSQVNAPLDVPESETHQEFISRVGKNHEKRKRAEKEEYQRNYEPDVKHGKYFNKWATDKYRSFFNEDTLNKKDISEISKTIGKIEITDKTNAFDVRSEDKETTLSGNTLSVKKDGLKKSMQPKSKDFHQSHHNYYNGYNYRSQHYANNLHNEYSNANIRNKVENPIYYPPRVEVKTKDRRNKFDYQQNVPNYIYHSNNYFDRRKPEYSELVWACVYIPQFYAVFNPRIPPPNHVSDLLVQNYVIYHN
uniref:Pre-mRNA-splicing factor SLU7 n=1 Tax=Rhabditophanes sp. KR3021 TaxID=114890 RepID=A0AC35U7B7_9BILA